MSTMSAMRLLQSTKADSAQEDLDTEAALAASKLAGAGLGEEEEDMVGDRQLL